jgi:type I restriction enzyme M protein
VLVGEIRNQIDSIWDDFWSGGVSNPLAVMEQITYLLFIDLPGSFCTKRFDRN